MPTSKKPDGQLRLIPPSSKQALPYPGPRLHQTRELHHSTSSVMLAMPSNVIRHRLVHSKTKWRFILPHLSYHVVPPFQLIGKMVSVRAENKTTNSVKRFCLEELDSCGNTDKNNIMNIRLVNPAVTETLLRGTHRIANIPCSAAETVLSTTRERNQCRQKGVDRVTVHGLLFATIFQSTLHPRDTPLVKMSDMNHTVPGSSLESPLFFVVQSKASKSGRRCTHQFPGVSGHSIHCKAHIVGLIPSCTRTPTH